MVLVMVLQGFKRDLFVVIIRMKYMKKLMIISLFALMTFSAQAAVPESGKIVFQILRDGRPFGMHVLEFKEQDDKVFVDIDIDMKLGVGPLTLFRYEHENREVWQGDRILELSSYTYDDGDEYQVSANWNGTVVDVESTSGSYNASSEVYSTSYWNKASIKAPKLLNTQKGKLEEVSVTYSGVKPVWAGGKMVEADAYHVEATLPLKVYYECETGQWSGLEFQVRGSEITYKRLTPIK